MILAKEPYRQSRTDFGRDFAGAGKMVGLGKRSR